MEITPTTTTTAAASKTNTSNANTAQKTSTYNIDTSYTTFIKLLTAQLKNQDPTNPSDSNEFTNQLISLTGLEQNNQSNDYLKAIVDSSKISQIGSASSFIGTEVKALGNQGELKNGQANFGYNLPKEANSVLVKVTNSSGQLVFEGKGTTSSGDNKVLWDGVNSLNGNKEKDGVYKIEILAKDANNGNIKAQSFVSGIVNSASIENGVVVLDIGKMQVAQSNVLSVRNL
jgi:flagellar basal-body rod modification protein FlgD